MVFGRAAANTIAEEHKPGDPLEDFASDAGEFSIARFDKFRFADGTISTANIRMDL